MSPTLEKLLYVQAGKCFFCQKTLTREIASIEHLHAQSNGGKDVDENIVACCKLMNQYLGNLALKEKLRILLSQQGQITCPMDVKKHKSSLESSAAFTTDAKVNQPTATNPTSNTAAMPTVPVKTVDTLALLAKLKPKNRPRKLKTLNNHITAQLHCTHEQADALIKQMIRQKLIQLVDGNKIKYDC